MIYMMKEIEARGEKIYNVFPLRSEMIPKHFLLDTSAFDLRFYLLQNMEIKVLCEGKR